MLNIGTRPPIGVNESCMALTAPHEASVVIVANSAELKMPKRTSLPSMFPSAAETPSFWWIGLPDDSAFQQTSTPQANIANMAHHTDQPCFWFLTMRPRKYVRALLIAICEATGPCTIVWVSTDWSTITGVLPSAAMTGFPAASTLGTCIVKASNVFAVV